MDALTRCENCRLETLTSARGEGSTSGGEEEERERLKRVERRRERIKESRESKGRLKGEGQTITIVVSRLKRVIRRDWCKSKDGVSGVGF